MVFKIDKISPNINPIKFSQVEVKFQIRINQ